MHGRIGKARDGELNGLREMFSDLSVHMRSVVLP